MYEDNGEDGQAKLRRWEVQQLQILLARGGGVQSEVRGHPADLEADLRKEEEERHFDLLESLVL